MLGSMLSFLLFIPFISQTMASPSAWCSWEWSPSSTLFTTQDNNNNNDKQLFHKERLAPGATAGSRGDLGSQDCLWRLAVLSLSADTSGVVSPLTVAEEGLQ